MNRRLMVMLALLALAGGCKKETSNDVMWRPSMSGQWQGNGTDDTIGYFEWSMDLQQDGDAVYGSYRTVSAYTTTEGRIRFTANATRNGGGDNITDLVMERTSWGPNACAATLRLARPVHSGGESIAFYYKGLDCQQAEYGGGANARKTVSTASALSWR